MYETTLITTIAINIIFALSLNFITGMCGQISLGHAAFVGVGAYTTAVLSKVGVPIYLTIPASLLTSACLGTIVGLMSLRVRHDFLAITTMGVGFLFVGLVRQHDALGGEVGISGIPGPGMDRPYFALFCIVAAAVFGAFCLYVRRSWMGFSFQAISSNQDVATLLGINTSGYKLLAFIIGTAAGGFAGSLYAYHVRYIGPDSFGFVESINILAMVIVGGMGSIIGVSIAAAFLSILPLLIQFIDDYKLLTYAVLLFLVMRFAPDGLAGFIRSGVRCIRRDHP